jgi:hypothetical protein
MVREENTMTHLKLLILGSSLLLSTTVQAETTTFGFGASRSNRGQNIPVTSREMDQMNVGDLSRLHEASENNGQMQPRSGLGQAKVKAKAYCNPKDGLFYMDISVRGQHKRTCLTSPGKLRTPTNLAIHGNRVSGQTKMHITSEFTSYPGVEMPWTSWIGDPKKVYDRKTGKKKLKYSGFATHATGDLKNLGHPASHGCLRLAPNCAEYLFKQIKKNGGSGSVHFLGYDSCGDKGMARQRKGAERVYTKYEKQDGVDPQNRRVSVAEERTQSRQTLFGALRRIFKKDGQRSRRRSVARQQRPRQGSSFSRKVKNFFKQQKTNRRRNQGLRERVR